MVEVPVMPVLMVNRLGDYLSSASRPDEPKSRPREIPVPEQTDDEEGLDEFPGVGDETPIPEEVGGEGLDELPGDDEPVAEPSPDIMFRYANNSYAVGMEAYFNPSRRLLLPDRTLLRVEGWLESDPPQPGRLIKVTYSSKPGESLGRTAERLGAILARNFK